MINHFLRKWLHKQPQKTARMAKERLQIIVSHQRAERNTDVDFLPALQKEIIDVIAKYIPIDRDLVRVELERVGDRSTLELNVTLPDFNTSQKEIEMTEPVE